MDSSNVSAMHSSNHLGGACLACKEYHSFSGITLKIGLTILWSRTCFDERPGTVSVRVSAPSRELLVNWIGCFRVHAANGFHCRFNNLSIRHCLKLLCGTSDVKQQENGDLKILIQVECLNPLAWAVADKIDPIIFKVLNPEGLRELEPKFGHVS